MNFRPHARPEPEINLIPFIDVLLVVLIFLMLSTTYSKFNELEVKLPTASGQPQPNRPHEIIVAVGSDGRYMVNQTLVEGRDIDKLGAALAAAANLTGETATDPKDSPKPRAKDSVVIISADASATHQAVVTVMEAARRQSLTQITFATQGGGQPADK